MFGPYRSHSKYLLFESRRRAIKIVLLPFLENKEEKVKKVGSPFGYHKCILIAIVRPFHYSLHYETALKDVYDHQNLLAMSTCSQQGIVQRSLWLKSFLKFCSFQAVQRISYKFSLQFSNPFPQEKRYTNFGQNGGEI